MEMEEADTDEGEVEDTDGAEDEKEDTHPSLLNPITPRKFAPRISVLKTP